MERRFQDEDVARLRIALARINRSAERTSADADYTRTQLSVLGTLVRLEHAGVGELAEAEGLNPTMLSRVVGKLEAAGLIIREADPGDRRAVRVRPTEAGQALHLRLRKRRNDLFSRELGALDERSAAQLSAALPALETLAERMLAGSRSYEAKV